MKIVFLGTPEVAVPTLASLLEASHRIPFVVTRPDRPSGRSGTPKPPAVKAAALRHGIAVEQPSGIRSAAFRERVAGADPDLLVVVAFGRILPGPLLSVPRLGAINLHFSLLPSYRGAAPVQWALANGDRTTGVTTMQVSERLDEGGILLQRELAIEDGEHAPALGARLARLGAGLMVETVSRLAAGELVARPQEASAASLAPRLTPADGEVDFLASARRIEGQVRGFDPWPGAWVRRAGKRIRLVEARAVDEPPKAAPPGRVIELRPDGLAIACGDGTTLVVTRIQLEGRRALSVHEAVNGRQIEPGDQLEQAARAR